MHILTTRALRNAEDLSPTFHHDAEPFHLIKIDILLQLFLYK
jgi:hypothetical protein